MAVHPEPDPEYPDTMRRLGDNLPDVLAAVRRARAAQQVAQRRGRFLPDEEDGVTEAMRVQQRWATIVGDRDATWRLGNLDGQVAESAEKAERWLAKGSGPLLIGGNPGRGKTALACAVAYRWAHGSPRLRPVLLARLADVLGSFERATEAEPEGVATVRRRLPNVRGDTLVILDDLRPTAGYPSQVAALTGLVDQLVRSRCRLVVTTNLNKAEREQHLELRLRSRIEGGATVLALTGRDLRDDDPPPAPPTEPCPLRCLGGRMFVCDLPDSHERTMASLAERNIVEPDGLNYPTSPEGDAMLARDKAWFESQYDHHATSVLVPCPACYPDTVAPPAVPELDF